MGGGQSPGVGIQGVRVLISQPGGGGKGRSVKEGRSPVSVCDDLHVILQTVLKRRASVCWAWAVPHGTPAPAPRSRSWRQFDMRSQRVSIKCPKVWMLRRARTLTSANAQNDPSHLTDGETETQSMKRFSPDHRAGTHSSSRQVQASHTPEAPQWF